MNPMPWTGIYNKMMYTVNKMMYTVLFGFIKHLVQGLDSHLLIVNFLEKKIK